LGFPTIAPPCASGKEAFREESNWPALMRAFSSALPRDGLSVSTYNAAVTPPFSLLLLLLGELMRENMLYRVV